MNARWAYLNKMMQEQLKKNVTFDEGIVTLLKLRQEIMEEIDEFRNSLHRESFNMMPYKNAKGYHNKTIAYSLYHVFRIEDIVCQTLIKKQAEVFFSEGYDKKLNIKIKTTGNELKKEEIAIFSSQLNLDELYSYIHDVNKRTIELLKDLSYSDLFIKMDDNDKENLKKIGVVSQDEEAIWLIEYWCHKNVLGLIQMPLSRHWIMHVEASLRIRNKLAKTEF